MLERTTEREVTGSWRNRGHRGNWIHEQRNRGKMTKEPDKTTIETPTPSPRKIIIALLPRWKNPTETQNKTSPSGAN